MIVIRVISELFFSSKITEVCRTLQIESVAAKSREKLEPLIVQHPDAIAFVDLGLAGDQGPVLAGMAATRLGVDRVWAFYSHVATELLEQAESLGATQIVPRSHFFEMLPDLLQSLMTEGKGA